MKNPFLNGLITGLILFGLIGILHARPSPSLGGMAITWTFNYADPTNAANAAVTSFNVYYNANGSTVTNTATVSTSASAPVTNTTIYGLTRGATYTVLMTAATPTLEGDYWPSASVTIPTKPGTGKATASAQQ